MSFLASSRVISSRIRTLRVPAHLRPALFLLAAIAAFIGALVWAFRFDAAVSVYDRQHALVTVGVLLVVAWVDIALWFRSQRRLERVSA